MIRNKMRRMYITLAALMMAAALTACSTSGGTADSTIVEKTTTESMAENDKETTQIENDWTVGSDTEESEENGDAASEYFTERDLEQTADTSEAEKIQLTSGQDVSIDKEGVYVISGEAEDVTITVEAGDEDKVQ